MSMMEIILNAFDYRELQPLVNDFCKKYSDDFMKNRDKWTKKDGYRLKVESARLANYQMIRAASQDRNTELRDFYNARREYCLSELERINNEKRW